MNTEIPRFEEICENIQRKYSEIPFKLRGIKISHDLIKFTIEILNNELNKTLPQNCRQLSKQKTPDGLDRRIKDALNIDQRTANIISDVLHEIGVVEVIVVMNPITKRKIKGTKLLPKWQW